MKVYKYFIALVLSAYLVGCGSSINKRITMGVVDGWAEGTAMTTVAKVFLEDKGYHIVTQKAAVNLLLASMNNGDTDIYMDVWLPRTHGDKVARFKNIQSLGVDYKGALMGLTVPAYVDISSIEELNSHKGQFEGRIVGIERGAGITQYTDSAIAVYGLDYTQMSSSTVAMAAELARAIDEHKWIVITGWQPHWLFGRYDLKFLEDPKQVYGEEERIEVFARAGLENDYPEVYNFFKHVFFNKEQMADLLLKMNNSTNEEATAKQWIREHRTMIDGWWDSKP